MEFIVDAHFPIRLKRWLNQQGHAEVMGLNIELARNFVQEIMDNGVPLKQAYLFGSHAKGTAGELSDIDVALIADEFVGVSFEDVKRFIDVTIKPAYVMFEIHTFQTADFENGNPFAEEVRKTGVRVV